MHANPTGGIILLTGASGYIGGRLLPELEATGRPVRCMARKPEYLRPRVGDPTEVVHGDVLDPDSLGAVFEGVEAAYYLIHSLGDAESFEEKDRRAAENFARAAEQAGVQRIIYLGGLAHGEDLSRHLASRIEVGRILRESKVPTIELRASIIIGSGSASFDMIRALVRRLPVMVTPSWVRVKTQPIAVEDVIAYLREALDIPIAHGQSEIFEIGGHDQVSYGDLMREYARQRNLKRVMIPVPVLSPWLSSLWLGLVTPLYARIGRQLIEGVKNETIVKDNGALEVFSVEPRGTTEAFTRALANEDHEFARTRWSDALSARGYERTWAGINLGSRIVDSRTVEVSVPPEEAFRPIESIGGDTGWYYADVLWHLRGYLDLLVGGIGMRRGRRDPEHLMPGDALDFWRVERVERPDCLLLHAEMKVPGRAWLQFEVESNGAGSTIRQTALFDPHGLSGLLYWYALYPVHVLIFQGMLERIARRAERASHP